MRAPLGDDDEHDFLAQWITWRDSRMAVADWVGEYDMDRLWESLREFGGWVCCSRLFGPLHIYSGFSIFPYIIHHYPPLVIWSASVCPQADGSGRPLGFLTSL